PVSLTPDAFPGEALAQCLQESDCVMVERNSAADCLREPLVNTLPLKCRQLKKGFGECKRGMVDMRKRFRGNMPVAYRTMENAEEGQGYQLYAGRPAFAGGVKKTDGNEPIPQDWRDIENEKWKAEQAAMEQQQKKPSYFCYSEGNIKWTQSNQFISEIRLPPVPYPIPPGWEIALTSRPENLILRSQKAWLALESAMAFDGWRRSGRLAQVQSFSKSTHIPNVKSGIHRLAKSGNAFSTIHAAIVVVITLSDFTTVLNLVHSIRLAPQPLFSPIRPAETMAIMITAPQRRLLVLLSTFFFIFSLFYCCSRLAALTIGPPKVEEVDPVPQVELLRADNPMSYGMYNRPSYDGIDLIRNLPSEYIPTSKNGRRLVVVGDIHGMLEPFEKLLKKIEFNPKNDHLIAVGDMINKGPKSSEVIARLMELKASAVRGNHEDRVILSWRALSAQQGVAAYL
ncbi:hypothetical protein FSARC_14602, partial [Fusarium sarcochroum]